jgi:hypothetical protein
MPKLERQRRTSRSTHSPAHPLVNHSLTCSFIETPSLTRRVTARHARGLRTQTDLRVRAATAHHIARTPHQTGHARATGVKVAGRVGKRTPGRLRYVSGGEIGRADRRGEDEGAGPGERAGGVEIRGVGKRERDGRPRKGGARADGYGGQAEREVLLLGKEGRLDIRW